MSLTNEEVQAKVQRYLELVATGTADEIVGLFAEDATLEDPVGSDVLRGHQAIRGFYESIASMKKTTELLTLRACGGEAAFHFRIITDAGDLTATLEPIEVMTFNAAGLVSSMRAWWAEADLTLA